MVPMAFVVAQRSCWETEQEQSKTQFDVQFTPKSNLLDIGFLFSFTKSGVPLHYNPHEDNVGSLFCGIGLLVCQCNRSGDFKLTYEKER